LFIAGGAFDGIERIISKRLNRQAVIRLQKMWIILIKTIVAIHYPKRHQRFWIDSGDYWSFASIDTMDPLDRETLRAI
jgi:ATP-dependent Clp protease ATP-binding subunit ClpX